MVETIVIRANMVAVMIAEVCISGSFPSDPVRLTVMMFSHGSPDADMKRITLAKIYLSGLLKCVASNRIQSEGRNPRPGASAAPAEAPSEARKRP